MVRVKTAALGLAIMGGCLLVQLLRGTAVRPAVLRAAGSSAQAGRAAAHTWCDFPRFRAGDPAAVAAAQEGPVLLTGWNTPYRIWSERAFMARHGGLPQPKPFAEDFTGTPHTLDARSGANVTTREFLAVARAEGAHRLLFTYSRNNPAFFEAIGSEWSHPVAIADSMRRGGRTVLDTQFSAAERMAQHYFHDHREAWLGLVRGRKWWWMMSPDWDAQSAGGKAFLRRTKQQGGSCSFLRDGPPEPAPPALGGEGALKWRRCLQLPGEVVWFPDAWWHATCSLDHWTVGVGEQIMDPNGLAGPPQVDTR